MEDSAAPAVGTAIAAGARVEPRIATTFFTLAGGVLAWAAAFLASYVTAALACARGFADTTVLGLEIVPLAVGVASFAALAGIAGVAAKARAGAMDAALREVALIVCLVGVAGVLWNALPALLVGARC